jgi:flagellum-specific ATP synthase
VDAFLTCGRGQRVGIFGGSGVGKSTLIGMMARNTAADLTVLGLVGERGREVREFLENALGEEGPQARGGGGFDLRSVAAAAHPGRAGRYRRGRIFLRAGQARAAGGRLAHPLAMAQREIGLAAGEPPTAKGYTPSCFGMLARLIERAGRFGAAASPPSTRC